MGGLRRGSNPFYALVVVVGVVFSITACAYGVMAFRAIRGVASGPSSSLLTFLDTHGGKLLLGEVFVLGLVAVAAMKTDRYWQDPDPRDKQT